MMFNIVVVVVVAHDEARHPLYTGRYSLTGEPLAGLGLAS